MEMRTRICYPLHCLHYYPIEQYKNPSTTLLTLDLRKISLVIFVQARQCTFDSLNNICRKKTVGIVRFLNLVIICKQAYFVKNKPAAYYTKNIVKLFSLKTASIKPLNLNWSALVKRYQVQLNFNRQPVILIPFWSNFLSPHAYFGNYRGIHQPSKFEKNSLSVWEISRKRALHKLWMACAEELHLGMSENILELQILLHFVLKTPFAFLRKNAPITFCQKLSEQ